MAKNYKKLLNNLLQLTTQVQDPCLFTKLGQLKAIDILKKFDNSIIKTFFIEKEIQFEIKEVNLDKLIEKIQFETEFNKIKNLCENYDFKITKFLERELKSLDNEIFFKGKKKLIEKIKIEKNKSVRKWQIFRHIVNEENEIRNVWLLHFATCFISIKLNLKKLYGPLLLKEMFFFNNKQTLQLGLRSQGEWKLNEKFLFYLNEEGIVFPTNLDLKNLNAFEATNLVLKHLKIRNQDKKDMLQYFSELKSENVTNNEIWYHGGLVLGLFQPGGGFLKKQLKKILNSSDEELESIIVPEINKLGYQKRINQEIENSEKPILKIQPSNFSQDRAIISSLKQDTIIWGPPGTGKSQAIANIIANIIYKNKKALVMSQKKAALDVLKERLNSVNIFCFFLTNNAMETEEFYDPLLKLVSKIENFNYEIENSEKNNKILSHNLKEYVDKIKYLKNNKNNKELFLENIKLIKYLNELNIAKKTQLELFNLIISLPSNVNFCKLNNIDDDQFINNIANLNNIQKVKKIFSSKFKKEDQLFLIDLYEKLKKISLINKEINLNSYKQIINFKDTKMFEYILDTSINNSSFKTEFKTDEFYLTYVALDNIRNKYNEWRKNDLKKYNKFYRFCNVIRSKKWLPYKFLANFYDIILEICPIIITTPQLLNFELSKKLFDYAILDESSQMFVEVGIPILYSAKTKVLAGDPKQMQPSTWFMAGFSKDSENENIIDERDIAMETNSLLDYGIYKGMFQIMLNENYRAQSAALMSFSAKEFYNSKLDVLDKNNTKIKNPIEIIDVNGKREEGINQKEAIKAIELTIENLNNFEKITILAFNSKQKQYIQKLIFRRHEILVKALEKKKLLLRNIENIQGDEADLVIISVTYDPNTPTGWTYVCRSGGSNALNVALSRARKKMIILKSITHETVKFSRTIGFKVFYNWLKFLCLSKNEQKKFSSLKKEDHKIIVSNENDVESGFEETVLNALKKEINLNIDILIEKQFSVGSKRIDIAILTKDKKFLLGIEVDGYRWHEGKGYQKVLEDRSRQNYIESKGYQIYRIKEYSWKTNPKAIIQEINFFLSNILKSRQFNQIHS